MALIKILGWAVGLGGLFGVTFNNTVAYFDQENTQAEQQVLVDGLQEFVDRNPSRIKILGIDESNGEIDIEKLKEEGKIVVKYQGKILGYKNGEPIYTLDKPHYLIFNENEFTTDPTR